MSKHIETVAIPLVEEKVTLDRETVETGRVRVRTITEKRTERVSEPLLTTDVVVERVPMDREIDRLPEVRNDGDTVIVPVVEERLVKKLFLIEEVRLTRRASSHSLDTEVTLRSQEPVIERKATTGPAVERQEATVSHPTKS